LLWSMSSPLYSPECETVHGLDGHDRENAPQLSSSQRAEERGFAFLSDRIRIFVGVLPHFLLTRTSHLQYVGVMDESIRVLYFLYMYSCMYNIII
jgi:hypothetical protein